MRQSLRAISYHHRCHSYFTCAATEFSRGASLPSSSEDRGVISSTSSIAERCCSSILHALLASTSTSPIGFDGSSAELIDINLNGYPRLPFSTTSCPRRTTSPPEEPDLPTSPMRMQMSEVEKCAQDGSEARARCRDRQGGGDGAGC